MKYLDTSIGERIRIARKSANITQDQLAKKLGLSRSSISSFEVGNTFPSKDECAIICEVCNINYSWLTMNNKEIRSTCKESKKPYKGTCKNK